MFILSKDKVASVNNKNKFEIWENSEIVTEIKLPEEGLSIDFNEDATTAFVGGNRTSFFVLDIAAA